MKTIIKTSIKGNENVTVKETVEKVYEELIKKTSFILLTAISHNDKQSKIVLKKSTIKMLKQQ